MSNFAVDIPNLLYRYADLMDAGDLAESARLFDYGCIVAQGEEIAGADRIEAFWRRFVQVHEDGTLKTRHLITNPRIELSEDEQSARCQSQWTGLQQTSGNAVSVIGSGRYFDEFALIEGAWRFTRREYGKVDFWGDASQHLKIATSELEE